MMGPETKVRIDIRENLKTLGFAVWDLEQNRRTRQTPGFSDLVAIGFGWILFLEVKTAKGKQSDAQITFDDEVTLHANHGTRYDVVRSWLATLGLLVEIGVLYERDGKCEMVDRRAVTTQEEAKVLDFHLEGKK